MQNVESTAGVVVSALFVVQGLLVLIRARACVRRSVPVLLAAFLLLAGAHPLLPPGSCPAEAAAAAAAWAAGAFLLRSGRRRGFGTWTSAAIAAAFTLLIARALGYEATLPFQLLKGGVLSGLAAVPLVLLWSMTASGRSPTALIAFAAGCAWPVMAGAEAWTAVPFAVWAEAPLCLAMGWLVFQQGYPERSAWGDALPSLKARQPQEPVLYTRLLAAESALAAQERATTAGYLALGAAHEFKNTISMVKLAAQHGLAQPDSAVKDRCLQRILEHTQVARDSAVDVLERMTSAGAGEPAVLDAQRDLAGSLRKAGAALRGEGVVVDLRIEPGVTFRARRSDVEQIVLNLVHNAAECYGRTPCEETRTITVLGSVEDDLAVIDVRDQAGGVPADIRPRLFIPCVSGAGSTGLGLFLSRSLALANGGNVDYLPIEGGSSFRLTLPFAAT